MPPTSTIWEAEPHTIAKHRILEKYLQGWMPAMLLGGHGRIVIIDGFAGPGEYVGREEGSPLVALRAYLDHTHRSRMSGELVFLFIESRKLPSEPVSTPPPGPAGLAHPTPGPRPAQGPMSVT